MDTYEGQSPLEDARQQQVPKRLLDVAANGVQFVPEGLDVRLAQMRVRSDVGNWPLDVLLVRPCGGSGLLRAPEVSADRRPRDRDDGSASALPQLSDDNAVVQRCVSTLPASPRGPDPKR